MSRPKPKRRKEMEVPPDLHYACEKFGLAVHALAVGPGDVRSRLKTAFMEFSAVQRKRHPRRTARRFPLDCARAYEKRATRRRKTFGRNRYSECKIAPGRRSLSGFVTSVRAFTASTRIRGGGNLAHDPFQHPHPHALAIRLFCARSSGRWAGKRPRLGSGGLRRRLPGRVRLWVWAVELPVLWRTPGHTSYHT